MLDIGQYGLQGFSDVSRTNAKALQKLPALSVMFTYASIQKTTVFIITTCAKKYLLSCLYLVFHDIAAARLIILNGESGDICHVILPVHVLFYDVPSGAYCLLLYVIMMNIALFPFYSLYCFILGCDEDDCCIRMLNRAVRLSSVSCFTSLQD